MTGASAKRSLTRAGATSPEPGRRAWSRTWWLRTAVRVMATAAAAAVIGQAFLAGQIMDGDYPALAWHQVLGIATPVVGALLLVTAAVAWRRAGAPGWAPAACVVLVGCEAEQIHSGFTRVLAVHVPLGIGVTVAVVALLVWAWRFEPTTGTPGSRLAPVRPPAEAAPPRSEVA